jgi:hypothetical protein
VASNAVFRAACDSTEVQEALDYLDQPADAWRGIIERQFCFTLEVAMVLIVAVGLDLVILRIDLGSRRKMDAI